jgi:hypothetical protein
MKSDRSKDIVTARTGSSVRATYAGRSWPTASLSYDPAKSDLDNHRAAAWALIENERADLGLNYFRIGDGYGFTAYPDVLQ